MVRGIAAGISGGGVVAVALALVGCGSGPEPPSGQGPDPGAGTGAVPVEGGAEERVTDDPHNDMDPSWTPF